MRLVALVAVAVLVASCGGARRQPLGPDGVLAAFRGTSPALAEVIDRAAAVAVFPDVEWTEAGAAHPGVLIRADGTREPIVLRSLDAPTAPAGYGAHRLVVLADAGAADALADAPLPLADFTHLHLDGIEPGATLVGAPGWIVTTRQPHLLFPEESPEQQLERATVR